MATKGKSVGKQMEWRLITYSQNIILPEVTISAFTETGQEESSIAVPLQRAYIGSAPVITSHLSDTPCATLGVQGLLHQLNTTLGTSHSLDTPSLSSLLEDCITNDYDFGMAYGCLRRIWYTHDWSTVRTEVCRWEKEDQEMRRRAIVGNQIVDLNLPPRRVWDLCSNRVVPLWSTGISITTAEHWNLIFRPISHAWMDGKDRADVSTPINGYEWPVPIPKDTNLNLIRIEMLNLGAQYVWLDVLCLRQKGGPREDMRAEEWKLDVPSIGYLYRQSDVAIYLSGLGRPSTLKEGDLESDRSWFRRAWTLQELGESRVIAGDTPQGPMQKRVSINPVDKVAILAFRLLTTVIPAYYESESLEEAWTALLNSMDARHRGALFVWCPEPGNAGTKWRPSWHQIITNPLPDGLYTLNCVNRDKKMDGYSCDAPCIEKGFVRGLAVEGRDRHGELVVKDKGGREHRFTITATHEYPIPEDTYTLILAHGLVTTKHYCVIGRNLPGKRFEKVSVLNILDEGRFRDLDITTQCRYTLV